MSANMVRPSDGRTGVHRLVRPLLLCVRDLRDNKFLIENISIKSQTISVFLWPLFWAEFRQ